MPPLSFSNANHLIYIPMKKPEFHFLVCNSYRVAGGPQGVCNKQGNAQILQYLNEQCADRGLDAVVSGTGCLNVCTKGPVVVVYPQNWWYGNINEEAVDEILDSLESGQPAEKYLISE